jgi:hypothetical protein
MADIADVKGKRTVRVRVGNSPPFPSNAAFVSFWPASDFSILFVLFCFV